MRDAGEVSRSRPAYLAALVGVILLGLASRRFPGLLPAALGKYPGDALWALMAFVGWAVVFPTAPSWKIAAAALGTAWAVEFSQLYQADWIRSIRATTLGRLALGTGFVPGDLVAYAVGAGAGWCGERWRAWRAASGRAWARDGNWTGWAERQLGDCPACRARSDQKWNHDACNVCGRGPSGG